MPDTGQIQDGRKIYRVSEINRLIRVTLENEFGRVWIEGEVSNLRKPASGHLYFTLKDETAQIAAVFFRGHQRDLRLEIRDGLKIRVLGEISVYEPAGQYQIVVAKVEEAGRGSLQEAFEALKKKLADEGLFDEARKKPIPILPQHVGIVTSPTGAAIRDILNILARRFPNLHIVIAPCRVQGAGAAEEIAAAIDLLNERGGIDVMIVGRGGGSLEDLWCFNDEVVARSIARSKIPVISAVGHEIDFTISDLVADLRAPTPSAAAELMVGQKEAFEQQLRHVFLGLVRALREQMLHARHRLLTAGRSYVFREPRNLVRQYAQQIDSLRLRILRGSESVMRERQQDIETLRMRLLHQTDLWRRSRTQDLRRLESQLRALSPRAVLDRGFSITHTAGGRVVRRIGDVNIGDPLITQLAEGSIESRTVSKKPGR